MDNSSDERLMAEFGEGNQEAFAKLYERNKGPLYRYFVRQLSGSQEPRAEELFQEVWIRVINKRESYHPSAKFTTWLYRIARNLLIDEHRKQMSEQAYSAQIDDDLTDENRDPAQRNKAAIAECVSLLPNLQREAFLLRHDSGFEFSQLCDIAQTKPEAMKSRLRYAMDHLRQCLTRKLGVQE
jgi:RNA polymerase sigma-70 factor (ECF subfamily)